MVYTKPVFISDRKKRYFEQAKSMPYSKEELQNLYEYLYTDEGRAIQMTLDEYLREGCVIENEMEETDDLWVYTYPIRDTARINFLQYLLIYFPKVFVFLTQVPDRQVPLYIHKPLIREFAIWRMKLARVILE